jgi:uncharacterized protein YoaH (UPF0181 family)
MSDENEGSDQEAVEQLYAFVAGEMQAGSDKATIAQKLEEHGVEKQDAVEMTNAIYDEIAATVQKEQFSGSAIVPGLLGGVLGAVLGGGIWAGIAVLTNSELGIIAWGIGGVCGFGVVLLSGGRKGLPLQLIAVVTSILGIVMGKYFTFYYFLKDALLQEYGEEGIAELSMFSMGVVQYFIEALPEMASAYDVLWVLLAVITAWRIPKGSGISVQSSIPQGPINPG